MSFSVQSQAEHQTMILDSSKDLSLAIARKDHASVLISVQPTCRESSIHLEVNEDAICDCLILIDGESEAPLTLTLSGRIHANAILRWHCVTLAKRSTHQTLISTVCGERGESEVNWMFACDDNVTHALRATNAFTGREGRGEMTLKGVARASGKASVYGMIDIGLGGTGTDTYLTEDVLMLSPKAKIDATPALEIKTNDVKASHSATISRVTLEDLFYFQSRGIDQQTAEKMYIDGFFGELFQKIPEQLQEKLVEYQHEERVA
jgi:Fe-S cluster assembly scaffold protein SufB